MRVALRTSQSLIQGTLSTGRSIFNRMHGIERLQESLAYLSSFRLDVRRGALSVDKAASRRLFLLGQSLDHTTLLLLVVEVWDLNSSHHIGGALMSTSEPPLTDKPAYTSRISWSIGHHCSCL